MPLKALSDGMQYQIQLLKNSSFLPFVKEFLLKVLLILEKSKQAKMIHILDTQITFLTGANYIKQQHMLTTMLLMKRMFTQQ